VTQLFYAYAAADARQRDRLEQQLHGLRQRGVLSGWHSRTVGARSAEGRDGVSPHVGQADLVLLLVSADLMADGYCYGPEVRLALERHRRGEARLIPVLLRPCSWRHTPIGGLAPLPADGKPVTRWASSDDAFRAIAAGIAAAAAPAVAPEPPPPAPAAVHAEPAAAAERPAASQPEPVPSEVVLPPHELGPGYTALEVPGGGRSGAGDAKVVSVAAGAGGADAASFQVAQLVYRAKSAGAAAARLEDGVRAEVAKGGRAESVEDAWAPGATVRRVRLVGRSEPGAIVLAAKDRFLVAAKVSGGGAGAAPGDGRDPVGLAEHVVRRMLARIPSAAEGSA
jgi:hypothetical protein